RQVSDLAPLELLPARIRRGLLFRNAIAFQALLLGGIRLRFAQLLLAQAAYARGADDVTAARAAGRHFHRRLELARARAVGARRLAAHVQEPHPSLLAAARHLEPAAVAIDDRHRRARRQPLERLRIDKGLVFEIR